MGKIGMKNAPKRVDELFHKEEKEFLVICIGGTYGSKCDNYWDKSIAILGYVETESGRTSNIKSELTWAVKDYDSDNNFEQDGIYRIKGRLPKLSGDEWLNNEYRMSSIYVTEIISDNEKNDFLESLLTEYKKEVSINSKTLGKMILDKELEYYETTVDWCGDKSGFSLSIVEDDNIEDAVALMEEFYNNRHEWDKKSREYAAKCLTELANDWQASEYYEEDEDDEEVEEFKEITEKEFAERLMICDISFNSDGNFTIYYDDDDMFWGHSVVVEGNIKTGFESANIMG